MIINWIKSIHLWAKDKGFWNKKNHNIDAHMTLARMMLVVNEISMSAELSRKYPIDFTLMLDDIYCKEYKRPRKNYILLAKLMLIVTEVSECAEAIIKRNKKEIKEEFADMIIRILDLCGHLKIDLEKELKKKMEINKQRPYLHGKKI